jgi:hypothetical protein
LYPPPDCAPAETAIKRMGKSKRVFFIITSGKRISFLAGRVASLDFVQINLFKAASSSCCPR